MLRTTSAIADRALLVLQTYLDDEVDVVDAADNSLATVGDPGYFTTPTVGAFMFGVDRGAGTPVRVLVYVARPPTPARFNASFTEGQENVREDFTHRVGVETIVAQTDGAWGEDGALRRCDRLATAARTLLMFRYAQLSVPDAAPARAIVPGVTLQIETDEWVPPAEGGEFVAVRRQVYAARWLQSREEI